jgi:proteasome lid subunit RPN8/RPN11
MTLDVRAIDASELPDQPAPRVDIRFRVFLDEEVFDRAVARGNEDTGREVGGVLLGRLLRDQSGPYLHVRGLIDALHADEKSTEVTFTHETWEHINSELDREHEGDTIVGWWHTHPGFGVFLSDRDQFIHNSFFNLPYQIALVYDPKRRDHGVFTWQDNAISRAHSYWVGHHEHSWDGQRAGTPERGERVASDPEGREADRPPVSERRGDPEPWAPIAILVVVALLLGGLVGWWFGGRGPGEHRSPRGDVTEAARAIKQLETELVRLWRQTMDQQGVIPQLDRAVTEMKVAHAILAEEPGEEQTITREALEKASGHLDEALSAVRRLRSSYGEASMLLTRLASTARGRDQRANRERALTRGLVANLYAEMAVDVAEKDPRRARRLLINAAQIDPDNHRRYEKQLRSFDKNARLPRPEPLTKAPPQ